MAAKKSTKKMGKKASKKKADSKTIQRRILFYRVDCGNNESGEPIQFDYTALIRKLAALTFQQRSITDEADRSIACCLADPKQPSRLQLGLIRIQDLPQVANGETGNLEHLSLPDEKGLIECTHMVFFPNNIVGVEFNFYGPRISRLRDILRKTLGLSTPPSFLTIVRKDLSEQLEAFDDITMFSMQVHRSFQSEIESLDEDLGKSLDTLMQIGEPENVEIVLRAKRKGSLTNIPLKFLRKLLKRPKYREEVEKLEIKGRANGHTKRLDLLSESLATTKEVAKIDTRNRTVVADSVFSAIEEAHDELKSQLKKAVAIGI